MNQPPPPKQGENAIQQGAQVKNTPNTSTGTISQVSNNTNVNSSQSTNLGAIAQVNQQNGLSGSITRG